MQSSFSVRISSIAGRWPVPGSWECSRRYSGRRRVPSHSATAPVVPRSRPVHEADVVDLHQIDFSLRSRRCDCCISASGAVACRCAALRRQEDPLRNPARQQVRPAYPRPCRTRCRIDQTVPRKAMVRMTARRVRPFLRYRCRCRVEGGRAGPTTGSRSPCAESDAWMTGVCSKGRPARSAHAAPTPAHQAEHARREKSRRVSNHCVQVMLLLRLVAASAGRSVKNL